MTVCASSADKSCAKSTGIDSSRRTRTGHYLVTSVLQKCHGLFAPHGRKLMQEFLEAVTGFEVVKQRLNGDACPNEHWRSAEPIWIAIDHVLWEPQRSRHSHQSTSAGLLGITASISWRRIYPSGGGTAAIRLAWDVASVRRHFGLRGNCLECNGRAIAQRRMHSRVVVVADVSP